MKSFLKTILVLLFTVSLSNFHGQIKTEQTNYQIKEILNFPFGTVVKLKIEIIDGESLNSKAYQSNYLIKILEVNNVKIDEPFIIDFKDYTSEFPENNFDLYQFLYGKKNKGGLTSEKIKKMNKNYVGKIFDVLAYESGQFVGIPNKSKFVKEKFNSFGLIRQDTDFYFKNYIIIESKLKAN